MCGTDNKDTEDLKVETYHTHTHTHTDTDTHTRTQPHTHTQPQPHTHSHTQTGPPSLREGPMVTNWSLGVPADLCTQHTQSVWV